MPLTLVADRPPGHPFLVRLNRYCPLSAEDEAAIKGAIEREYAIGRKRDVVVEGYDSRKIYAVGAGFALRYKLLNNGGRQVLSVVLPGDVIGFPTCVFDRSAYSVVSLTDMSLQVFSVRNFMDLCYRRPNLAMAMIWFSGHELVAYSDHIIDLGRRTPLERTARFLLEMHSRLRTAGLADAESFDLPMSQEVIGDVLGLSTPHVNRMFQQLRAEKLISARNHRVTVEDAEGLQFLGQFRPRDAVPVPLFD